MDTTRAHRIRTHAASITLSVFLLASLCLPAVSTGVAPSGVDVLCMSTTPAGTTGTGNSTGASLSNTGRYVAFSSLAEDLVAGDTNGQRDVFVRDTVSGTTERVSVSTDGEQATDRSSEPSIDSDGRYVAFQSEASDLVAGDTNGAPDVFLHDRQLGTTVRVSVDSSGAQVAGGGYDPSISANGRYVAFYSPDGGLVAGDTNGVSDMFVRDMQTDAVERVSVATGGTQAIGGPSGYSNGISADGRYVVFTSEATNLVASDTNGAQDVFVHDRQTDTTERVSLTHTDAQIGTWSYTPDISGDGRYVLFANDSTNVVADDTNSSRDVFVRDRQSGTTERATLADGGGQCSGSSDYATISSDGRFIAFSSSASDVVDGDTNSLKDVFIRDTQTNEVERVSITETSADQTTGGQSYAPRISPDGTTVGFTSEATNIVDGDENAKADVFTWRVVPTLWEIEGADRYRTSIAASQEAFSDGAGAVVIATGSNWPDALGGAALAGALDAPLLLTRSSGGMSYRLAYELARLDANTAYILGGTAAVSPTFETELTELLGAGNVHRLAGADRYATAKTVAEETISILDVLYDGTAFVATGGGFADALSASPIAAALGHPVLLAPPGGNPKLPDKVTDTVILGGEGAVAASTEDWLESELGTDKVQRVGGANRYATAAAVAEYGIGKGLGWNRAGLASGTSFPDGLVGGAMLADSNTVMLLTRQNALPSETEQALTDNRMAIRVIAVLGGTGAISQTTRDAALVAIE